MANKNTTPPESEETPIMPRWETGRIMPLVSIVFGLVAIYRKELPLLTRMHATILTNHAAVCGGGVFIALGVYLHIAFYSTPKPGRERLYLFQYRLAQAALILSIVATYLAVAYPLF